jgi:Cd2+/Zn2+-exporting ATPase
MNTYSAQKQAHKGIFGKKTELYFALLCGLFLLVGFLIEKLIQIPASTHKIIYAISYVFGGYFVSVEAIKK